MKRQHIASHHSIVSSTAYTLAPLLLLQSVLLAILQTEFGIIHPTKLHPVFFLSFFGYRYILQSLFLLYCCHADM